MLLSSSKNVSVVGNPKSGLVTKEYVKAFLRKQNLPVAIDVDAVGDKELCRLNNAAQSVRMNEEKNGKK